MDYEKLKQYIEYYKKSSIERNTDVDELFIAGIVTSQFVKFTGEDLDSIHDTLVREHIWMDIETAYKKVLEEIKEYDKDSDDYISNYCDDDEEKYEKEPYDYKIFLEAIKEAKKKNPKIYVTRYGIYTTEIFEEYAKLYHKTKELKKPIKKSNQKKKNNTIQI